MLSLPRLAILAQQGLHERLIDAVLRNGRPLPIPLRARLADEHNAPIAALSLAVQRYLELAARPTIPLRELTEQLLDTIDATRPSPANLPAFALAATALTDAEQAFRTTPPRRWTASPSEASPGVPHNPTTREDPLVGRLRATLAGIWHALACAQNLDPDTDSPLGTISDAHTTALLLRQLPRLPDAADHLHLPLLIDAAFTMNLADDPLISEAIAIVQSPAAAAADQPCLSPGANTRAGTEAAAA